MYFNISYVIVWVVVAAQGIAICVLVRHLSELRRAQVDGTVMPPIALGSVAPEFAARSARTGQRVESLELRGKVVTLLFLSADCMACRTLVGSLSQASLRTLNNLAVYCRGGRRGCLMLASKLPAAVVLFVEDEMDVVAQFKVSELPVAFVLSRDWKIVAVHRHSQGILAHLLEEGASAAAVERAVQSGS